MSNMPIHLINKLLENKKILELHKALQEGHSIVTEELWNAPKAFIAALAQKATGKNVLIFTGGQSEEGPLFHDISYFTERSILDFPAWETLPGEGIPPSADIVGERYSILEHILNHNDPSIILTTLQATLQKLILPKDFNDLNIKIKVGDLHDFDEFIEKLKEMGYKRSSIAADKGEFAVRGGIIDVFPVSSSEPYRIEFWDIEIESIRSYDPIGQKSIAPIQECHITPAQEMEFILGKQELCTIFDYLKENVVVIFDDIVAIEDRYASLLKLFNHATTTFANLEELLTQIFNLQKIFITKTPLEELSDVKIIEKVSANYYSENAPLYKVEFEIFNRSFVAQRWIHPFIPIRNYFFEENESDSEITAEKLLNKFKTLDENKSELKVLCTSEAEENNFYSKIQSLNISLPKNFSLELSYLSSGFVLPKENFILFPMTELTKRYKIRRQKLRSTYHTAPSEVFDLSPGEMVVHINNGIGKYLGQEKRKDHNGIEKEFMAIEYAENSKLYVPMNQIHMISKYIGSDESIPRMHTLGSKNWQNIKIRTEKAIIGYAQDLLDLYAKREIVGGFPYPEDSDDLIAFEDEFPYAETEDQLEAIQNIKRDMMSKKAMDRLVCGDVGYGKTEVAMRAAFKAVVDGGKQVAILVPTTVLAMQHYENFVSRMRNFPIKIGVLSRFISAKQTRETLEGITNGSVDILIGTHRIISEDIIFKDLGLIIIDEEHRFGVKVKEHLKRVKIGVDCLTLSATPIPRTLYMSLIGARDMSTINTPPQDRLPIKTVLSEPNDIVIKNALIRELARDGQAYFIHNRVETITEVASRLKNLVPGARVSIVHGQMKSSEIDEIFHAFKKGNIDVLVATSILESGIDIPNANTIIIDKAHMFGFADLYQLRGRVGRWNRRAYAYFLIPRLHSLAELPRKRLDALAESTGYGGGMRLAMKDLELRGAGDILGIEQSGHVSAVGFHFYCKMLTRAIKAMQKKLPIAFAETKVDFYQDARLPESYIADANLRMEIYQRLGEATSWEDLKDIWDEMIDRFGEPPESTLWLYHYSRIRVFASQKGLSQLKIEKTYLITVKGEHKNSETKKYSLKEASSPAELEEMVLRLLS